MYRFSLFLLLTLLSLVSSTQAEIVISSTGSATEGLPGFSTHIVTATSTVAGELIVGVDFAGDGSNDPATGRGFFGPMNQFGPPVLSTIYMVTGHTPPGTYFAPHDSYFLVNQNEVVIPSGLSEESSNLLQGIWAWQTSIGQSVDIAQLVIPDSAAASIFYRGVFAITREGTIVDTPEVSGVIGTAIPEPATMILFGVAMLGLAGLRLRWQS